MRINVIGFLLFTLAGSAMATAADSSADNWTLVSSKDASWIKTANTTDQHELLVAYHEDSLQFLLILKTDRQAQGKSLPVSVSIDQGLKQKGRLYFLEKKPEQSILRMEVSEDEENTYLSQMISGLTMTIYFDFSPKDNAIGNITKSKNITFSLKGFTVAFNDLLIANDIGSLDPEWLMQHNKDRELYCLITTNISIEAMQYRLDGKSYKRVLHLIKKTGFSIIDHNLAGLIEQVYKIPKKNLSYVPRAEKYLMFLNCMKHTSQSPS